MDVLAIQGAHHESVLGHVQGRARKRPRTPAESTALLALCKEQLKAWVAAGGKEPDCVLRPLIVELERETGTAAVMTAKDALKAGGPGKRK